MPNYDYKCLQCGNIEEQQKPISDRDAAICTKCGFGITRIVNSVPFQLVGPNWAHDGYSEESAPCTGNSSNPAYAEYRAKKEKRIREALSKADEKVNYHY